MNGRHTLPHDAVRARAWLLAVRRRRTSGTEGDERLRRQCAHLRSTWRRRRRADGRGPECRLCPSRKHKKVTSD